MWTYIGTQQHMDLNNIQCLCSKADFSQLEEAPSKVAVFAIENYWQIFRFCKINGSARIHISVDFER